MVRWSGRRWHQVLKRPRQLPYALLACSSLIRLLHAPQAKHAPGLRVIYVCRTDKMRVLAAVCHAGCLRTDKVTCECVRDWQGRPQW